MNEQGRRNGVSGRVGSWLWFQNPLLCRELVPIMYDNGMPQEHVIERLADRFSELTIRHNYAFAHYSRFDPGRKAARRILGRSA